MFLHYYSRCRIDSFLFHTWCQCGYRKIYTNHYSKNSRLTSCHNRPRMRHALIAIWPWMRHALISMFHLINKVYFLNCTSKIIPICVKNHKVNNSVTWFPFALLNWHYCICTFYLYKQIIFFPLHIYCKLLIHPTNENQIFIVFANLNIANRPNTVNAAIEVDCGITNCLDYTCKLDQLPHIQVSLKVSCRHLE